jgi:hypothetical protein
VAQVRDVVAQLGIWVAQLGIWWHSWEYGGSVSYLVTQLGMG